MINVILFEPEIPENVGNIARTCVSFNAKLHLIKPYGFIFDKTKLKRSSANHWKDLDYCEYDSFDEFLEKNKCEQIFIYSRYGDHKPSDFDYSKLDDVYLMFGRESTGVDIDIIKKNINTLVRIPMSEKMQSMNLSNTVAIGVYEVLKQHNFKDLCDLEPHKKDYLK